MFRYFGHYGVLSAIQFDDQLDFRSSKVGDIVADDVLAAKFDAVLLFAAQVSP